MSDIVYAKQSVILAHAGQRVRVNAGEPWDAADPLVRAYPESFGAQVKAVRSTQDPRGYHEYEPVERATAAPGERRMTPRRRKNAEETPSGGTDE